MIDIPVDYFSDLSSYEEFVIKTNLLGYDVSDKEVLSCFNRIENYYWFVINGHLCFLDDKGNKAENVVIKGDFDCFALKLISLEGSPKEVGGSFNCAYNQLTSLEGCPEEVGRSFDCYRNKLTSLEGCPKEVGGNFYCSENKLTSLEGCPNEVGGYFNCYYNSKELLKPNNLECKEFYN